MSQPSFVDATRDVGALLDTLQEAVVAGTVRPIHGNTRRDGCVILLGLQEDSDYYLSLRRADDSGTRWVGVHESTGVLLDEWPDFELGSTRVRALWASCRSQLFSPDLEAAVAGITLWLRRRMR